LNRTRGLTVLFVTHELVTAARHATHAALFRGGSVRAGRVEEVFTEAGLEATYGVPVAVHPVSEGAWAIHVRGRSGDDRGIHRVVAAVRHRYVAGWLIAVLLAIVGVVVARDQIFLRRRG
jgi:ABC-type cobalamin/Fe3+-siderophores transport system ATPase subunit